MLFSKEKEKEVYQKVTNIFHEKIKDLSCEKNIKLQPLLGSTR